MSGPALFHFSEEGGIVRFDPRPVAVLSPRAPGMDWLNGPLVWAIDAWHQPLYLFPRDCPRILAWPTGATSAADRARHWPGGATRMLAFVEHGWMERLRTATIRRYALPGATFEPLGDAGMWVSRAAVMPAREETLTGLPDRLREDGVELRAVGDLRPLRRLWHTSLHVSGIRLRNAATGWP